MNAEDMYMGHPHLMTREEHEEFDYVDSGSDTPTHSPVLREWILFGKYTDGEDSHGMPLMRPSPEAQYRQEFEHRPPALGATPALLNELRTHNAMVYSSVVYINHYGVKCYDN